jgi:hypothetical protein
MLILKKEIKREIDPLWSIKLKQYKKNVYKDFDLKVIFQVDLFFQTSATYINACMPNNGDLHNEESISPLFLVTFLP